ncbi:hypothetical protein BH23CHL7_BH23CHL7_16050 [soil metagenome]
MKADTIDLAAVFYKQIQYVVPLYQRPYVWNQRDQWEPLWEDVVQAVERHVKASPKSDPVPHFLGAVVLEQLPTQTGKMIDARSVIDGQQRLTTLQLMIAAARSLAIERGLDDTRQAFEDLLFNRRPKEPGDELKVLPTSSDRIPFRESMDNGVAASTGGQRVHEAYRFFRKAIGEWSMDGASDGMAARRLQALSEVVWRRLVIVAIDLDRGDNAQVIFETLNARGTPLLAADLIKNHLFQAASAQGEQLDELYEQYWRSLDTDWWRDEVTQGRLKRPRLDIFINHWLAMASGAEVVSHQLFPEFKRYVAAGNKKARDVLADLTRYGVVYERFEKEPRTTPLGRFLERLGVIDVTTAYPALLWLLGPEGLTDESERLPALHAIESWLVRRMLTRQTTKNYNAVFLGLLRHVRQAAKRRGSGPVASDVVDYLAGLRGESQFWPKAASVRAAIETLPLYRVLSQGRLRMVMEALEEGLHTGLTERFQLQPNLTIEHVLPQEWEREWLLPEDADPMQARFARDEAKHRLGNLTLVTGRLNPKMSNGPWPTKRDALQQYSLLLMSADLRNADSWDESAIAQRGKKLASTALSVWSRPDDEGKDELAAAAAPAVRTAGPPDPEDPVAFAEALAIADEVGVGAEIRRIIAVSRQIGLHPRPHQYGVRVAARTDKRRDLFSAKPQWEGGGTFGLWRSPQSFAETVPELELARAQEVFGASEDVGVLLPGDVDAFLDAVRAVVPADWASEDFEERRSQLLGLGIENADQVPGVVLRLIDGRSTDQPEMALRFAAQALAIGGVGLRGQDSINQPWYFQVRHSRLPHVVAYAHPFPGSIRVEYALPNTHDTYGRATARSSGSGWREYGISLIVRDEETLETAARLLRDAIASNR